MSIVEYSHTEAALATLREKHAGPFDVATTAGMKQAKEARAEVRGYRVALEAKRVEIKAPALERCREIDAEAKRITAELLAIEEPIDDAIKTEEARKAAEKALAEKESRERATRAQRQCTMMRMSVTSFAMSSSVDIEEAIQSLGSEAIPDDEHRAEVAQVRMETLAALCHLQAAAHAREAEARRMAEDRAELERAKAEAARVAKAESDRIEASARVERERLAVEEAKAKAARDEADRLARIERDRLEAEARAARAEQDHIAKAQRALEDARLFAERQHLQAEAERQRKERAFIEAEQQAKRDAALAKERALQAEKNRMLDAWSLLAEFVRVYGEIPEFARVVAAIRIVDREREYHQKPREAANG